MIKVKKNTGAWEGTSKNVGEAVSARQKQAKKRSLRAVNEHFEPVFNAAMTTQVVFRGAREGDRWRPLCYALAATLLVIGLRAKGLPGVENTLWAEDGSIFLKQALSLGIGAIFEPYAGYLHLWPRLFAFLASILGLASAPLVMFLGWALGYFLMASLVVTRLHAQGVSFPFCFLGVILVGLQPSTSETFFNVTNAQWYLSIALAFLLLLNGGAKSVAGYCLVFVLSLTGPFCIILAPLVIFRAALERFRINRLQCAIFFCCVLVQLYFLIGSGRGGSVQADKDLYSWLGALGIFLRFGEESLYLPAVFWCAGILGVFFFIRRYLAGRRDLVVELLLLIVSACLFYLAGLWSYRQSPLAMTPLGEGARYFIPVYGVFFLLSTVLFKDSLKVCTAFFLVMICICFKGFSFFERKGYEFYSFAAFAKVRDGVVIPISPNVPAYPGWHVLDTRPLKDKAQGYGYALANVHARDEAGPIEGSGYSYGFSGVDPQFEFSEKILCKRAKHIGMEIGIDRAVAGWMQLFWRRNTGFSEANSIRRYYPAGRVKVHFAFPYPGDDTYVRFDPAELPSAVRLEEINIYCLGGGDE